MPTKSLESQLVNVASYRYSSPSRPRKLVAAAAGGPVLVEGIAGLAVIEFIDMLGCLVGALDSEKFRRELLRLPRSDQVDPTLTGVGLGWAKALVVVVGRDGGPMGCIVFIGENIVGGGREVMLMPSKRSTEDTGLG